MQELAKWLILFMIYSFVGWLMEVILSLIDHKKFINRGFLIGPICPIYGTGAVILSLILHGNDNFIEIFVVSLLGGAILEYTASWIMESVFRVRWWDYSEKSFNLNGRICLKSVVSFGFFGILIVKVTTPLILGALALVPSIVLLAIAGMMIAWMVFDIALSLWLILGVRVTVGTVQKDATEEISERVQEILMEKGKLNRRLVKAFPNQTPSKKTPRRKRSASAGKKPSNRV